MKINPMFKMTCISFLLLYLSYDGYTSPIIADSTHVCVPFDYEQYRSDHPLPATKRLTALNVGEPRTVRIIHFLPQDRPFSAEVIQ